MSGLIRFKSLLAPLSRRQITPVMRMSGACPSDAGAPSHLTGGQFRHPVGTPPPHSEISEWVRQKQGDNWSSLGWNEFNQKDDAEQASLSFLLLVTGGLVFVSFCWGYSPKHVQRDWYVREAYLVLREREAAGVEPISRDFIDPDKVWASLPSDEELKEAGVVSMSSSHTGYPSVYHSNHQQHLNMGSLHNNVPRALPGNLHSQGLQGRVTPTQLGNRNVVNIATPVSMQGMNFMPNSSTASASNRNSLFTRKMGDGSAHFDPSDFPSLAPGGVGSSMAGTPNRSNYGKFSIGTGLGQSSSMAGTQNFVGMVKQPAEHSEFQMSNEDFPALPGAPASDGGVNSGSIMDSLKMAPMTPEQELKHQQQQRKGIQTGPDGMVTNIPATMVTDQFGMIGLLTFIRAAETDPNLVSLALGTDLTTLGLNLNSDDDLFQTFGGPWADTPCRPQDIDFHVPHEYLTNTTIRDKLAPVKLNRYKDDILFFLFYTNVGDVLQLAAAAELHNRDWRYHKEEQLWITRAHGMVPTEKTQTYERGTYYFFDVASWRKVPKEFHLDYDKLEERPSLPASGPSPGPSGGSPGPVLGGPQQQGL